MALDPTALRDLFDRVAAGDVAWIRERFQAGELDGLRDHLDNATWRELPTRLESGDVAWVRVALSGMQLPGVGAAEALRRGEAGLAGATVAAGFAGLSGAAESADPDHVAHAREVRAHLADGDLSWLRAGYRSERLDWLRDDLTADEWADLPRRLDAGDVGWVRRVIGGVVVPGVGLLGASELVTEGPVTWTPPRDGKTDRRPGWLLPTGVIVTVLAVLALLLSQCDSGGSSTAPSTAVATSPSPTIAVPTTVAATTTAAPTTTLAPTTTVAGSVDLVATAASTPTFSTLTKALAAAELTDTLKATGPFTLFAPSDAAFAKLPAGTLEALLKSKADLAKVLTYHVVPGRLTADQLVAGDLKTVEGDSLKVALTNGKVTVNDATVTSADVPATNGVLHVIDTVLLPPGFTGPGAATAPPAGTVLEVAAADGRFTTLLKALTAAGLENTLKGGGPFTVFAPTDDAFKALGDGVADKLLTDKATLSKLLTYHVVAGKLTSDSLKIGPVRTVAGSNVTIGVTGGKVSVNDAKVVTADVAATNGIIHVIDKVLVPEGVDLSKLAATPTTASPSTTVAPTTTTTAAPPTTTTTATPSTTAAPGALAWTVYFDSDSATLRSDALATIRDAAPRIPDGAKVSLVGVADTRGNAEANQKLSADRAKAVQKAFENAGVKATFTITAKGAEPNSDLQKARRVEISVG